MLRRTLAAALLVLTGTPLVATSPASADQAQAGVVAKLLA